ncbi:MAG: threonylcarbamoyl-AMP synthase [Candidatus Sungbacteria bacterium]|uniref:L-threonylcarbamoyladenylate synthase n=1 Tax=Candidatus Sungiibacteriota bacterium TaxID=2750080 RepID=A0A9D6LQ93_9BACT|nr:threonylcarbamoyl-AMP synthase [Candidatus Sungbacteria bacterium]
MEIITLTKDSLPGALFAAVQIVKRGGVIVFPTDTIYGIGGNAELAGVAKRVIRIKARLKEKGMPILVRDVKMARKYAYIDMWTEELLGQIWPGAVSVILHKKDVVPDIISGGRDTIAIRVSAHPFMAELFRQIDFPLIGTSANRSGAAHPKSLDEFLKDLRDRNEKPDLIINAGELQDTEPSTILDVTNRKNPVILRKGVVTKSQLEELLERPL